MSVECDAQHRSHHCHRMPLARQNRTMCFLLVPAHIHLSSKAFKTRAQIRLTSGVHAGTPHGVHDVTQCLDLFAASVQCTAVPLSLRLMNMPVRHDAT